MSLPDQTVDAAKEKYHLAHLLEETVLFTPNRIRRNTVPDGLRLYELAHGDDPDIVARLAEEVDESFWGSVLSTVPYDFGEKDFSEVDGNSYDFFFDSDYGDLLTLHDFQRYLWERDGLPDNVVDMLKGIRSVPSDTSRAADNRAKPSVLAQLDEGRSRAAREQLALQSALQRDNSREL